MCILFLRITSLEELFDSLYRSGFPALLTHNLFRKDEKPGQSAVCQMTLTVKEIWKLYL